MGTHGIELWVELSSTCTTWTLLGFFFLHPVLSARKVLGRIYFVYVRIFGEYCNRRGRKARKLQFVPRPLPAIFPNIEFLPELFG